MSEITRRRSLQLLRSAGVLLQARWLLYSLIFLCAWASAQRVQATPPLNDQCTGAEVIRSAGPFPYFSRIADIADATTIGDPPLPPPLIGATPSRSVWYVFTPSQGGFYTLSSCRDAPADTTVVDDVMAIYTSTGGCGGALTVLPDSSTTRGFADESCGPGFHQAAITTGLNAGTTYYIVIWQYDNSTPAPGTTWVQLRVNKVTPPSNNTCDNAIPLTLNLPLSGPSASSIGAVNNYQLVANSPCFTGLGQVRSTASGAEVVYTFAAPANGNYSFRASNFSEGSNLVLYVAASCPNSGAAPWIVTDCLGASHRNDVSSAEEVFGLPLIAGQLVYVFVDGNVPSLGSSFTLEVTPSYLESEPNNTPYTASLLSPEITGSISAVSDVDFFALGTWPAGSRVFAMIDASSAKTTDFDLRVTTTNAVLQFDSESDDILFGDRSPNISGTPLPASPAFLRVNTPSSVNEPYRLYAAVQPPLASATVEVEPNNTTAQANSSPINYFYGTLSGPAPSTDTDVYAFNAVAGDLIFVGLDGDPLRNLTPLDAQLELLDSQGAVLVVVDNTPLPGPLSSTTTGVFPGAQTPYSPGEALVYRPTVDGVYYVRVSVSSSPNVVFTATSGDYLLSIAKNGFVGDRNASTPPIIDSIGTAPSSPEGGVANLWGSFIDPDMSEVHSVTINWGDGQPTTNILLGVSVTNFAASHFYADDPADPNDNYQVSVTVADQYQNSVVSNALLKVINVPPSAATLATSAASIKENDILSLSGTFADVGALDTHNVSVNWGDGSTASSSNLAVGVFAFDFAHRYLDNRPLSANAAIVVTITDKDGGTLIVNTNVAIQNLPPAVGNLVITSPIFASTSATLTGSMADTSSLDSFVVTVNWGDGGANTVSNYVAGTTSFSIKHLYTTAGTNRTVSVTLADDDGGSANGSTTITVMEPAKPRFQSITRLGNGHLQVSLQSGSAGVVYKIQTSSTLLPNSWSTIATRAADASGNMVFEDSTTPLPSPRFYRASWP